MLLLALLLSLSWSFGNRYLKSREARQEIEDLQAEVEFLASRRDDLRRLIDYLDSDQYIDEQARKHLNYRKEGETLVVVNDGSLPVRAQSGEPVFRLPDGEEEKPERNPAKWFRHFFHHQ